MKDRIKDKLVEMVRFDKIQISKLLRDVRRKSLGIPSPAKEAVYLANLAQFAKCRACLVITTIF